MTMLHTQEFAKAKPDTHVAHLLDALTTFATGIQVVTHTQVSVLFQMVLFVLITILVVASALGNWLQMGTEPVLCAQTDH